MNKIIERAVKGQPAKATFINSIVDIVNSLVDESNEGLKGMTDEEREQLEANTYNIERISSSMSLDNPLNQSQYNELSQKKHALYFIVDDFGKLQKIYYKSTLIAKRGETPNNISFPYTFPIVFS